jgi:peptidase C25-like protein/PKD domain-containing protein
MKKILILACIFILISSSTPLIISTHVEQKERQITIYNINPDQFITFTIPNTIHPKQTNSAADTDVQTNVDDDTTYLIITIASLYNAILASDFLSWKSSLGFNIKIMNITDPFIGEQSGKDLPEKIRNSLRSMYETANLEYLLIVGDHDNIPMRYCYPNPDNHRFDIFDFTSGEVPTDYYYSDLSYSDSESWDMDGDGFYGEYTQDIPDFYPDIYVGRIPTINTEHVTYSLDKIKRFEEDINGWKHQALHAGAFFYFDNEDHSGNQAMDGAVLSYHIEKDIMNGWRIDHFSEQEGYEKSVYDWVSLSESNFINAWRNGQYSIVNWQGHGWTNRVARKVWNTDDGDSVPEFNEIQWHDFINRQSNLDDDYPSIVTAVSCYVGCPEKDPNAQGNLGIDLLTHPNFGAAVGVVASARSPYGSLDWPNNQGGSDQIIYEFNKKIILNEASIGSALYRAKYECNDLYGWDHYAEYIDMFTFNLYGDPSMKLLLSTDNHAPEPPVITGPQNGKIDQEYEYVFTAVDPDGDEVSYLIDWGVGDTSGWTRFRNSGDPLHASYTWEKKGTYTIRAKAKDDQGVESSWNTLSVSMPKQPTHQLFSALMEKYYQFIFFLQSKQG